MMLDTPWQVSTAEFDDYLRLAGVEPVAHERVSSIHELDIPTRMALVSALRESVRHARVDAPPVERWMDASQALFMDDDGSATARQREDAFWSSLTRIVKGCLALVMLGDLTELPFFVELLKHQPAGHLIEMATNVLCHYVDPSGELDTSQLIRRAEEWFQTRQASAKRLTGLHE